MKSPTYGNVDSKRIVEIINEYFLKNNCYGSGFEVTIGTDSQNFSDTKVVSVIAVRCIGHGGIYFYDITHVDRINNVKMKLNYETQLSLQLANEIISIIEEDEKYEELYLSASFVMSSVRTPASLPSLINATLGTVVMPRRLAMPADL